MSSTIGFKAPGADLHRKSSRIFALSFTASVAFMIVALNFPLPENEPVGSRVSTPPVIIQLQNIPETRFVVRTPAPAKPFTPGGIPIEVEDEFMPDDITIEDTSLDIEATPTAPPALFVPGGDTGAADEEGQIFEFYAVEQEPVRLENISPEYPAMAERAGIEGNVSLKVLVSTTGAVDSVVVLDGPDIFHEAAIQAARITPFDPARHNDRPVNCWVYMSYRFQMTE